VNSKLKFIIIFLVLLIFLIGAVFLYTNVLPEKNKMVFEWHKVSVHKETLSSDAENKTVPADSEKSLYLIIDDVGNSLSELETLLALDIPMTFAIMPGRKHSQDSAELIHSRGHDFILHQPMEALGPQDPGWGAIMQDQSETQIRQILIENIDSLPGLIAVNNHMGSLITSQERYMLQILEIINEKKLLFIDSLTTSDSVVEKISRQKEMTYIGRDIFLDNTDDREEILQMLEDAGHLAERKGHAVMIGHIWSNELASALKDIYPVLLEEGFSLKEISEMLLNGDFSDDNSGR